MDTLTPRQLAAVRAHVSEGTGKAAAHSLGIRPQTLANILTAARHRLACDTTEQAVYMLTVRGDLVVPARDLEAIRGPLVATPGSNRGARPRLRDWNGWPVRA